jgi:hypothetical protein
MARRQRALSRAGIFTCSATRRDLLAALLSSQTRIAGVRGTEKRSIALI